MVATVIGVVATHNLAIGVGVGVLLSGLFFAWRVSRAFTVTSALSEGGRTRTYVVDGQLFYASSEDFLRAFDFKDAVDTVIIDLSQAHVWDLSSVAAVDMAVLKFRREGADVELLGMNEASKTLVDRLGIHDTPGALDKLMGH